MRLQSAIFTLPDALLDGGALRPGADKVLSILKMESVWLYAVTALDRTEAQALLRSAGIEGDFRGLLTEREAGCAVCSGTMLEKAMRRLRSQKEKARRTHCLWMDNHLRTRRRMPAM